MFGTHGINPHHVAEIIVDQTDGSGWRGSGYRITRDLVLTAEHVVRSNRKIKVRFDADRPEEWVSAAKVTWFSSLVDAALLKITPRANESLQSNVKFGSLADVDNELTCSMLGFPRFKLRHGAPNTDIDSSVYRDSCHRIGRITSLSHRRERTLEIKVDPPERDPDPLRSPWEGMSGAPVFVHGRMVGLVREHHRSDGLGTLSASRLDEWHNFLSQTDIETLHTLIAFPTTSGDLIEARSSRNVRWVLACLPVAIILIAVFLVVMQNQDWASKRIANTDSPDTSYCENRHQTAHLSATVCLVKDGYTSNTVYAHGYIERYSSNCHRHRVYIVVNGKEYRSTGAWACGYNAPFLWSGPWSVPVRLQARLKVFDVQGVAILTLDSPIVTLSGATK